MSMLLEVFRSFPAFVPMATLAGPLALTRTLMPAATLLPVVLEVKRGAAVATLAGATREPGVGSS
jgi:hypothetical protein